MAGKYFQTKMRDILSRFKYEHEDIEMAADELTDLVDKAIIGKDYTELTLVNLEHDNQRILLRRRLDNAKKE